MSFEITLDYRFDTSGFFDDPERRAALEAATDIWESYIKDDFEDVPAGTVFTIDDPSNAGTSVTITLEEDLDDLILFVGAEALGGALGMGGYDGVDAQGDVFVRRIGQDFHGEVVSDFEPWAGTVVFTTDVDWNFDVESAVSGKSDFISVALHEMAHVLGIGTSPIFRDIGASGQFEGVNSMALNDGDPVPLQSGLGHVANGFDDNTVLMDPLLTQGTRMLPGRFDLALLADIGYEIDGYIAQGETPPLATEGDDITIFGTILGDTIDGLGGRDQIQGDDGDDVLMGGAGNDSLFGGAGDDTLVGGLDNDLLQGGSGNDVLYGGAGEDNFYGQGGNDTFVIEAGGGKVTVADFDTASEKLILDGSGFESASAAVAAITKPFSNVSQIEFADGTQVLVFHGTQTGTPLDTSHIEVIDPALVLSGGPGKDTLVGGAGDDSLDGGAGNDVLDGRAGDDTYWFDNRYDRVLEAVGGGYDRIYATAEVTLASAEIEQVILEGSRGLRVNGNAFGTEIQGNSGSNILIGGGGGDVITGGAGTDYFAFLTSDAQGGATVTDFGGSDKLALDDRFFGLGDGSIDVRDVTSAQVSNALRSGAARYEAKTGELWIREDGTYDLIVTVTDGGVLSADDFLLF